MSLIETVSAYWFTFQQGLFPWLEQELGPLGERCRSFVQAVELAQVEDCLPVGQGGRGRPLASRAAMARAFIAKAVFDQPATRSPVERLQTDRTLRRLCGWDLAGAVPGEATFSRAFAEFAAGELPGRLHEALLARTLDGRLAGRVSRDSTAIEGRERPAGKPAPEPQPKRKRGRPRKGEQRPPAPRRLARQPDMNLEAMLHDLPQGCDTGTKRNAKGRTVSWRGYKLHIDAIDGGIPVSCLLTAASLHDSQAAIPLATRTAGRVDNLYDRMDSARDAAGIRAFSKRLGHVPLIDVNPRGRTELQADLEREAKALRSAGRADPAKLRYRERSTVERVNGRLKDDCGGRRVRVRGRGKVLCHLLFGVLALTVEQLLRLALREPGPPGQPRRAPARRAGPGELRLHGADPRRSAPQPSKPS